LCVPTGHSQVILDPPHVVEIFILDEPPGATPRPDDSQDVTDG
jgi:hypothetical protein